MELLPDGLGPGAALGLAVASFATSWLTATLGLGGGVALLALMGTLLPASALIPVHGAVQFGSNLGRAWVLRGHIVRTALPAFLAGAVLGVIAGGAVAVQISEDWLDLALAAFILWSVIATPPAWIRRSGGLAGAVSSVLTMFFGATGPFVAAWIKAQGYDRMGHVATHGALMTAQHGLKVAVFAALGFAFGPWLPVIGLLVTTGFLGTLAGRRTLMALDERLFRRLLDALLIVLALNLARQGVAELVLPG